MIQDPINKVIIQEIGLCVDNSQKIIDQDTREVLKFKDKNMKYSSSNSVTITKNDIPFDPINTKNLMVSLFDHFTNKIEQEDGTYISLYYDISDKDKGSALEAVVNGEKVITDYYNNESLKYLDLIMRLNGTENVNLKQYDTIKDDKNKKKKR